MKLSNVQAKFEHGDSCSIHLQFMKYATRQFSTHLSVLIYNKDANENMYFGNRDNKTGDRRLKERSTKETKIKV
jgi:hypothetical protein